MVGAPQLSPRLPHGIVSRGLRPDEVVFPGLRHGVIPGKLTEIAGGASSGRTSFLCSMLAAVTASEEYCVVVDAQDAFDPQTAAQAGVRLSQLLWVRCAGNVEHALKATDWLARAGGFGL